jgi:hypothetical protein
VNEIFSAFASSATSRTLYREESDGDQGLPDKDSQTARAGTRPGGLETVYQLFYTSGYYLRASPSYWDLMTATDGAA